MFSDMTNLGVAVRMQNQLLRLINQLINQGAVDHFLNRGSPIADVVALFSLFLAATLSLTLCLLLHCL